MRPGCAFALAGATLLSFGMALAHAQAPTKAQQDAIRGNCRSDFMRNCSSVTPGGREALECLMRNKAKVSAGCQGALNAMSPPAPAAAKPEPKAEPKAAAPRPEPAPTVAAPSAPAQNAPAQVAPPPQPPIAAAPAEQRTKPKPAPKAAPTTVATPARPTPPAVPQAAAPAAVPVAPPPAAAPQQPRLGEAILIRRFCTTDFKVLCKGVPLGQGRAIQCLANNAPALSRGCRQAMAQTGELRP